jgi:hypothetical protein
MENSRDTDKHSTKHARKQKAEKCTKAQILSKQAIMTDLWFLKIKVILLSQA